MVAGHGVAYRAGKVQNWEVVVNPSLDERRDQLIGIPEEEVADHGHLVPGGRDQQVRRAADFDAYL